MDNNNRFIKYIPVEKLIAEIERLSAEHSSRYEMDEAAIVLDKLEDFIASIQQEQPEDIVAIAKTFLDALSKTPYNNKPITDAQTIVKQLLIFLNNPKLYNPDALSQQEQPEVDLEKEYIEFVSSDPVYSKLVNGIVGKSIARHFYELGLNARKEK